VSALPSRQERLEQNQRMFRDANGRFEDAVEENALDGTWPVPFLCECADIECRGRIEITTGDYDAAHIDSDHYVILPGHATIEGGEVVDDNVTYLVVDKDHN
jgi:hypothetical protein